MGDHTIHLDYDGTNALFLPTATEAMGAAVRSKYDEAVDADPTLPAVWSPDTLGARSSIRIAGDVTPTVVSVSAPGTRNGTYGVGEVIDMEVLFTTRVYVKDSFSLPYLLVEVGNERSGDAQVSHMGNESLLRITFLCACLAKAVGVAVPLSAGRDLCVERYKSFFPAKMMSQYFVVFRLYVISGVPTLRRNDPWSSNFGRCLIFLFTCFSNPPLHLSLRDMRFRVLGYLPQRKYDRHAHIPICRDGGGCYGRF